MISINQLYQAVEASKTRSINKAAENLYMCQPNLSNSLNNLEEELGVKLFNRSNRGITKTKKGELFVEQASLIISQYERLHEICQPNIENHTSLNVANGRMRYVTYAMTELYKKHKNQKIEFVIKEGDRKVIEKLVANGDCEIGIIQILDCYKKEVTNQLKLNDISFYQLATDDPKVVVGKGNPLFDCDASMKISGDMLSTYPEIRYVGSDYAHFADKSRRAGIVNTAGTIITDDRATIYELLDKTDGFFVASANDKAYSKFNFYQNAKAFDFKTPSYSYATGWIKRTHHDLSEISIEFIDLLTEILN